MARKINPSAATHVCLQQAEEIVIRLTLLDECKHLAAPVRTATSALEAAQGRRMAAEKALLPLRVQLSFADYGWDRTVRSMAKVAEAALGAKNSPAYRELFRESYSPLVTPTGPSQQKVAEDFIARLGLCKLPESMKLAEEWRPKLQQAAATLAAALTARAQAEATLSAARADEQMCKQDLNRTVDKTIGEIRALFPGDRKRQDLAFPKVVERTTEDDPSDPEPAEAL